RGEAFHEAHFPSGGDAVDRPDPSPARRRLAFEELFVEQLGLAARRAAADREEGAPVLAVSGALKERLGALLPFALTQAQRRVLREIAADLQATRPMHRLLQGDVGSGKTLVAAMAMAIAAGNGRQAALMAPTELLAEQHAATFA